MPTARVRIKLEKQPEWDERFKGWAAKYISKNMWRVDGDGDYEPAEKHRSLMQDAYITFRHIRASYPLITEPSHIMALFKAAMVNDFNDRAKDFYRKRAVEISLEAVITEDIKLIDSLGEENNEGLLRIVISELPDEARKVLEIFSDEEKLALLRQPQVQSRIAQMAGFPMKRESLNDLLCRIIRLPKGVDLVGMLKSALTTK